MTVFSRQLVISLFAMCVSAASARAQVSVSPTGVNVNSQGATSVFLTFGGLTADLVPAEAFWCGELIDAAPDIGTRCDPATLFGRLPLRFDLARTSGTAGFTDIMSIPPSVARRAYQAAAGGASAAFFYVRRFASRSGQADVFVAVTCRLTAGGAGVPLSLTDVRLAFDVETPVLALEQDGAAPTLHADITYTGTGRLQGRWEVVLPGEDLPTEEDLLPEASLPFEQRGTQRRFTQLERFSVFLPPTGRIRLPGPDPQRLPRMVPGSYLVLLRIDATDDRDSQSDLAAVGAGRSPLASGAVAGFATPTLRYVVGSGAPVVATAAGAAVILLGPAEGDTLTFGSGQRFSWNTLPAASWYRLDIQTADGAAVFEALIPALFAFYQPPPLLAERAGAAALRWRIRAEDAQGRELARSAWRRLAPVQP